jgi:hypothetical protein
MIKVVEPRVIAALNSVVVDPAFWRGVAWITRHFPGLTAIVSRLIHAGGYSHQRIGHRPMEWPKGG